MSNPREYGYALITYEVELPTDDYDSVEEFKEGVRDSIGGDPHRGGYFGKVNFPEPETEYVVTTIKSDDPEGRTMTDRFDNREDAEKYVHAVNSLPDYAAHLEEEEEVEE